MSGSNDHIAENARRYGKLAIAEAARLLQAGKLVAVPTETVYGLAADSTNPEAVAGIYRTKGRPDFNPLIVHVPDLDAALRIGEFHPLARQLADKFWPGPLTLVVTLRPDAGISPAVTAGLDTIALRCPAHPVMQELLRDSGLFLAAPSANRSGGISPTTADHVRTSLGPAAPAILDAGACSSGLESTIITTMGEDYTILRPGPVSPEDLEKVAGRKAVAPKNKGIQSPGQLASHYAPSKPLRLDALDASPEEFHIGFGDVPGDANLSAAGDLAEAASRLYALLHQADASDRPAIAVAPVPVHGAGLAIADRLARAAFRS
ncbi:translation factor SUA5 [Parasphingorhabdus marina DSM 22363]|uniref:Threonylcarbamoyl-AMP synthase n=1 Tax=Parasphingorhabdus marina DSM 22363 TaxID=1123272 RepID=A0A1N6CUG2_9SPHN|nr:L-threonylcarbamoyladenylate synthase [Parasphingorhabdus marina]SIN62034.1 translation factor SUA5 [Parasphingorhabdus marina DSM 22363]